MINFPPLNEDDEIARGSLVSLSQAMLDRRLSFIEGAVQVLALKNQITGIRKRDPDFGVFALIVSESDHLPLAISHSLWSPQSLQDLSQEFSRVEEWAEPFASSACRNFISRFKND